MRTVRRTVPVALSCAVAGLLAGGCGQEAPDAQSTEESAPEASSAGNPAPGPVTPLERGVAFLEENGRRANVVTTPSGLQYEVLESGTGATPGPTDYVKAHYHGTLIDGRVFDSSVQRGQPSEFPVDGVIGGWTEALQLMQVGDKWRLYIPPALAYGKRGAGGTIGPDETLIFEVELISVRKA